MTFEQLDFNGTYTYADYLKWTFAERLELIKGKIFNMSPAPSTLHQKITGFLFYRFYGLFKNKSCQVFTAPYDVRLNNKQKKGDDELFTVVQPDVCIICDQAKIDEKGCVGAPDLIVEVLSKGNTKKEMKDKFEVYEENGVREYWLVSPNEKVVFMYVLNESNTFIGQRPFTETDVIESVIFPKLKLKVKDIFKH